MARRVIGIDFGAYSVKLVRLETNKNNKKFEIIDMVEEPLSNDENPYEQALKNLQQKNLLDSDMCAVGLSSLDAHMRSMVVPFFDTKKISSVLLGLLESEVPFELDEVITSWYLKNATKNFAQEDISTINIAFAKKTAISSLLQALQTVNIDPRIMNLSSALPYELVRELGVDSLFYEASLDEKESKHILSAIIDLGHLSTNLCLIDKNGLVVTKSIIQGGAKLTDKIAQYFSISYEEAQNLKHEILSEEHSSHEHSEVIYNLVKEYYTIIIAEIERFLITYNMKCDGSVSTFSMVGKPSESLFIRELFRYKLANLGCKLVEASSFMPTDCPLLYANALANAFSCLNLHSKEGRFNFRKDEFAWRGNFDFLKNKSVPISLWGMGLCSLMLMIYFSNTWILDKELNIADKKIQESCFSILGKKNQSAQKCLSQIKEQINQNVNLGIPEISSTDLYLKISKELAKEKDVKLEELDIAEKRLRINGETSSYENIEKIVASLQNVSCLRKIEKNNARQMGKNIKFQISSDIECSSSK